MGRVGTYHLTVDITGKKAEIGDEIKINLGDATNLKNRFDYVNALLKQEKDNKGTLYVNGNLNEGFLPYFYAE